MCPRAVKVQFVLAIDLAQVIFRQLEILQPGDEIGAEHLGLAVEGIPRQPDQFLGRKPDGTRMIELGAQFGLIDIICQSHGPAAIDQRESDRQLRIEVPDHLQHQQLVEIGIEQAADDWIEPPVVIIGPCGDIGDRHQPSTEVSGRSSPWASSSCHTPSVPS